MKTEIKAAHTPGPWTFEPEGFAKGGTLKQSYDGRSSGYVRTADRKAVARVMNLHGWEAQQANARLIAAAPDLLMALKEALEFVAYATARLKYQSAGKEFEPNRESAEGTLGRMEQAIAKAEATQ